MTEEIVALVEKAKRYLRSAELLRRDEDYESSISRLYYVMFYCAEALLLSKGLTFSSHRGVISGFGQHLVKEGELSAEMHAWLREAFDKRQLGEYETVSNLAENDASDLQRKAEQFLQRTEAFLRLPGHLS